MVVGKEKLNNNIHSYKAEKIIINNSNRGK